MTHVQKAGAYLLMQSSISCIIIILHLRQIHPVRRDVGLLANMLTWKAVLRYFSLLPATAATMTAMPSVEASTADQRGRQTPLLRRQLCPHEQLLPCARVLCPLRPGITSPCVSGTDSHPRLRPGIFFVISQLCPMCAGPAY